MNTVSNQKPINLSQARLRIKASWKAVKSLLSLSALLLLAACSSKVTVVSEIPAPLVPKVPLNVHLSYTDEFKNHIYVEKEKRRALSSLNFADAQIQMFDTIFSGVATLVPADDLSRDVVIEPEVLDFQYTAPSETKLKQYEVWIKYRLKLKASDDSKLADWTIKGYGKTPTALLTSASKAFNSAANVALRDVGAQLATRFGGQRRIKALIAQKADGIDTSALAQTAALSVVESQPPIQSEAQSEAPQIEAQESADADSEESSDE